MFDFSLSKVKQFKINNIPKWKKKERDRETGTYSTQQKAHKQQTGMRKSANFGGKQFEDYSI